MASITIDVVIVTLTCAECCMRNSLSLLDLRRSGANAIVAQFTNELTIKTKNLQNVHNFRVFFFALLVSLCILLWFV